MQKTAVTHRKSFGFILHEYIMRTNLFLVLLGVFSCIMYIIRITSCMQVYIYTSPQCQATKVSQLPERDAGERRLVITLAQQHLKVQVYRIYIGQKLPCRKLLLHIENHLASYFMNIL